MSLTSSILCFAWASSLTKNSSNLMHEFSNSALNFPHCVLSRYCFTWSLLISTIRVESTWLFLAFVSLIVSLKSNKLSHSFFTWNSAIISSIELLSIFSWWWWWLDAAFSLWCLWLFEVVDVFGDVLWWWWFGGGLFDFNASVVAWSGLFSILDFSSFFTR